MDNMININELHHSYMMGREKLDILKGVNFSLENGKWCCVYGASGSGKTTLLNLLGALEKPCSGTIMINGYDISRLNRRQAAEFRGKNIGFIFQSYHLINELDVLENTAFSGTFGNVCSSNRKRAIELLEAVGLGNRLHHRPSELSGGERQRCAIARSLMNDPALILADEPTGNLDEATGKEILELFCSLRKKNPELTIVMITHNPEITSFADVSVKLENGCIKEF